MRQVDSLIRHLSFLLAVALCIFSSQAMAQRRVLPVIDLVDVPVAIASTHKLSAQQVRSAIIAAALAAEWDVDPQTDGSLRLSALRDLEYRITLRATNTASTYSIAYISSDNLKTLDPRKGPPAMLGTESLDQYAESWRATRGALQPEFKYAVQRTDVSIHPTYEQMVYELSAGVRRHLKLIE